MRIRDLVTFVFGVQPAAARYMKQAANTDIMLPCALTIAGSDSSGGAGIQADLKTFTVLRTYGMSAITAVTAQNTCGVERVFALPADVVRQQIEAVVRDMRVDATKTGMLFSAEIAVCVARALRDQHVERVVVDPVMVAGSGDSLASSDLRAALIEEIIPRAMLVTPNLAEAAALTGMSIETVADMRAAAAKIVSAGADACLVKGGHLQGAAIDVFAHGTRITELTAARRMTQHTHGTGCQLSAAITAYVARGEPLDRAVEKGKQFVTRAIEGGLDLGHGCGPANPLAWMDEGDASD